MSCDLFCATISRASKEVKDTHQRPSNVTKALLGRQCCGALCLAALG